MYRLADGGGGGGVVKKKKGDRFALFFLLWKENQTTGTYCVGLFKLDNCLNHFLLLYIAVKNFVDTNLNSIKQLLSESIFAETYL